MKSKVYANILTSSRLTSLDDGRRLLEIWSRELPSLVPEKYGNYEPLRKEFTSDGLESIVTSWEYPFLLRKKKPKMSASVFMGGGKISTHGWIHIVADYEDDLQIELLNFVREVSVGFGVDFAFIHLLTAEEFGCDAFSKGVFTFRSDHPMRTLSITTHELRKNIPNLYWATFFGRPYSELFGHEKFHSIPTCAITEELVEGVFCMRLSEDISELEFNFSKIDNCRSRVKQHLDSNVFYNPALDPWHQYSVPLFVDLS